MSSIGFIGAGNMGGAIVRGLLKDDSSNMNVVVVEHNPEKLADIKEHKRLRISKDIGAVDGCDLVVVAVKPQYVLGVVKDLNTLGISGVVSIAAGLSLEELARESKFPVCRVMPNTPAKIGKGMSLVTFNQDFPEKLRLLAEEAFRAVGEIQELSEQLFASATALSGCGPAYIYLIIEALIDAGCAQGLKRDVASKLVTQTLIGAAEVVQSTKLHPAQLKDEVTSPGGVTIQALKTLETQGIRGILWEAVDTAVKRENEMLRRA